MRLWRISSYASLDGIGGLRASGRWHTAPRAVVYCADHPSTALLEVLVHLDVDLENIPDDYKLIEIEVPDDLIFHVYHNERFLNLLRENLNYSRHFGDELIDSGRYLAISLPSVILPIARVHLLNIGHVNFSAIQIVSFERFSFDTRLF